MLRRSLAVLMGGVSGGCGFAALGLALYAQGRSAWPAAALFGSIGFVCGVLANGLHAVLAGLPGQSGQPLAPQALAGMVRATLALAASERAPRAGSAADRPTPAPAAAAVPAPDHPSDRRFATSAFGA